MEVKLIIGESAGLKNQRVRIVTGVLHFVLNYMEYVIIGTLVFIAAVSNGIMDFVSFRWHKAPEWMKKRRQFWDPQVSWKNKWNYDEEGNKIGEKFWLSSTLLVSFTDAWHLFKNIMIDSYLLTITYVLGLEDQWYVGLILKGINSLFFHYTFHSKD